MRFAYLRSQDGSVEKKRYNTKKIKLEHLLSIEQKTKTSKAEYEKFVEGQEAAKVSTDFKIPLSNIEKIFDNGKSPKYDEDMSAILDILTRLGVPRKLQPSGHLVLTLSGTILNQLPKSSLRTLKKYENKDSAN